MFNQCVPIPLVTELTAERDWYRRLGFEVSYKGSEFPGFIALRSGSIQFALQRKDGFDEADNRRPE